MNGAVRQLLALLALRWTMVRPRAARVLLLLGLATPALLVWLVVFTVTGLSPPVVEAAVDTAPQAFAAFGVLALIAPLTGGGGSQLFSADELAPYPVRPATHYLSSLMLAPANLIWVIQLVGLTAVTTAVASDGALLPGLATVGLYVLAVTIGGQAVTWAISGVWHTRRGRMTGRAALAALLVVLTLLVVTRGAAQVLTLLPGDAVVRAVEAGSRGDWSSWALATTVLASVAALATWLGVRACAWSLRRTSNRPVGGQARAVRRRSPTRSPLGQLVALDRNSVWRAPALRRGLMLLTLLPAVMAAAAALDWPSIMILPALASAGAGLLFGINAFCLDGSGALFLAALPVRSRTLFVSKTVVLAETVLGATLLTVGAAALRSPRGPTLVEAVAVATSIVTCSVVVLALCLRSSVRQPHRADLRGPRDAVAPPGAMAWASVRLSLPTAAVAIVASGASAADIWWLAPALVSPAVGMSALSLRRSARRFDDAVRRARVVHAVAAG